MSHKLSRRALLGASLGAAQFALLDRFGLLPAARADAGADAPTRLLVLYLPGGARFYPAFVPLSDADITRYIPPPADVSGEPIFFRPADVVALPGDSGGFQPLRVGRNWNPTDPGDRAGFHHSPMGYGWLQWQLSQTTAVVHGVDNGSFAHGSAYISAMCGVPSAAYRSPALVSVVANYLAARFAATRPIPCVAVNSVNVPEAPGLPARAAPTVVPSQAMLTTLFSSDGMRQSRWQGCDARTATNVPTWDGAGTIPGVGLSTVDALMLERTRGLRGTAGPGGDTMLEQIYGSYVGVSQALARDVVSAVEHATPVTITKPDYLRGYSDLFSFTYGLANGTIDMTQSFEWVLRLLKSNVTSVVFANLPEQYYDFHNGGQIAKAAAAVRAQLDMVARMLGEMKATPSPDRPGKTLYDDTLVVVMSEFGRSWMSGPDQSSLANWRLPDDHNPITSVVLSGGGLRGNRQIGGFRDGGTAGEPVQIVEEAGAAVMRPPRSADLVASVCRVFGMRPGADFFIPGGYGVIQGLCA